MIWSIIFMGTSLGYFWSKSSSFKNSEEEQFFFSFLFFLFLLIFSSESSFWKESLALEMSWSLLWLTLMLFIPTSWVVFQKMFLQQKKTMLISLSILFLFLLSSFYVENIFFFFFFFEFSVIPILLIIFIGGSMKSKGEASLFLFIFTSLTAFFLLASLAFFSMKNSGDSSLLTLYMSSSFKQLPPSPSTFLSELSFLLILITFFVKMPVFFLHMWLPKAHVEAPVMGSMILASIMLKLGGYGLFIFGDFLWSNQWALGSSLMAIYLAIVAALACYGQKDLKVIIALSSVNHMTFVYLGMMSFQAQALWGALLLMLGHGVISSFMFFLSSKNYTFLGSRSMFLSKSSGSHFIFSIFWMFVIFINSGFPPFLNFTGEITIFKILFQNYLLLLFGLTNFMIIGLYSVLMLSKLSSSKLSQTSFSLQSGLGEWSFLLVSFSHCILIFFFSFFPILWS